ncbi:hypothetical protein C3D80_19605 [Cronobacter sakazakii]|uniref:hypothetical protein n=1 Tax=Cronobacter sakazakii TaxID=28141 RepID=UPI000A14C451|nr:hypothetical protein [Cronobacter sakazakii]EJJ0671523.1 hypothetical protein [Cronobacter sakazakii]PPY14554.1 hypothetical protein C3D80_19605 [Cronobacter sakazakii]PPY53497.1 hypothetical protein C3D73_19820 [Cronobacter sakazakii]PQY62829.1 hypothetical protein C5968_21525 [Cronobacter sakazakii]PQY91740.1 hypothetical protein C5949_18915 [Cronobacter sakazakii]
MLNLAEKTSSNVLSYNFKTITIFNWRDAAAAYEKLRLHSSLPVLANKDVVEIADEIKLMPGESVRVAQNLNIHLIMDHLLSLFKQTGNGSVYNFEYSLETPDDDDFKHLKGTFLLEDTITLLLLSLSRRVIHSLIN